jgi:hypothetical protein
MSILGKRKEPIQSSRLPGAGTKKVKQVPLINELCYKPCLVTINAPPGGGKTHTFKWIIWNALKKKYIDFVIIYDPNKWDGSYTTFVDEKYVFDTWDEAKFCKFLADLEKPENQKLRGLVVFDDWKGLSIRWEAGSMPNFITRFRKWRLRVFIACQYPKMVPPLIRSCVTDAIILKNESNESIKAMYESYGYNYPDWKAFKAALKENTANYGIVYWCKRPSVPGQEISFCKCPHKEPNFSLVSPKAEEESSSPDTKKRKRGSEEDSSQSSGSEEEEEDAPDAKHPKQEEEHDGDSASEESE